jgi:hypothetical protein
MMDSCKIIPVIETTLLRRGDGTEGDPVRIIKQYWNLNGELLWEIDEWEYSQFIKRTEAQ